MAYTPIGCDDVFAGLSKQIVFDLEKQYGNTDLIRALEYAHMAGPFKVTSPWELDDPKGVRRINASGYAATPFGDCYPPLMKFVRRYLDEGQTMGLPQQSISAWRAALETNLVRLVAQFAPSHANSKVFFSNSGSEAIEAAIKFAKAWRPNGTYFINFQRAFHGKTTGALSLTANEDAQKPFRPLAFETLTPPFGDLGAFEQTIRSKGEDNIIAVVLEPIQGEAGVIVPPRDFLAGIDRLAKQYGIPVIVDEIQAGLGRSGYWVPSIEWGGMDPDIITFAKPLGGGMVPVGATVVRDAMFSKMLGGLDCKIHSNTFGGNSLAMAIGLKSLEILREEKLVERSGQLGVKGLDRLKQIAETHPDLIAKVRGFGMWFAIEFHPVIPSSMAFGKEDLIGEFTTFLGMMMLHKGGVHANMSLNAHRTVRLTPPLTVPEEMFDVLFDRIDAAADKIKSARAMLMKTPPKSMLDLTRIALGR
ncbi:MAG: aminotransferase class III-fold pyridoxal phosphate-dependent enzyme [Gammaproteobacteria bacterium]|jgi:acetylornithine/succinyldiaminopimelate/putrescine aminotransferase